MRSYSHGSQWKYDFWLFKQIQNLKDTLTTTFIINATTLILFILNTPLEILYAHLFWGIVCTNKLRIVSISRQKQGKHDMEIPMLNYTLINGCPTANQLFSSLSGHSLTGRYILSVNKNCIWLASDIGFATPKANAIATVRFMSMLISV